MLGATVEFFPGNTDFAKLQRFLTRLDLAMRHQYLVCMYLYLRRRIHVSLRPRHAPPVPGMYVYISEEEDTCIT
jgi:hypothetical protein